MAHSFMNKCESGERAIVVVELWALANIYGKAISCFAPISYKANKPKEPLFLLNPQRVCRNPKAGIGNVIWGERRTVLSSLTYVRTNSLTNLDLLSARAAICRSKHRLGSSRSRVIGPPWATLIAPAFVRNATQKAGGWHPGLYLTINNPPSMELVIEAMDESGSMGLSAVSSPTIANIMAMPPARYIGVLPHIVLSSLELRTGRIRSLGRSFPNGKRHHSRHTSHPRR
jgi:hypothetical protein